MENKGFLNMVKGDKVVWIVVLLLIMISMITISGSTSLLALQNKGTRLDIIGKQVLFTLVGFLAIFLCYIIPKSKPFEIVSRCCFIISLILLIALDVHIDLGRNFRAVEFNGVYRAISIKGFQVHIFEIVKVAMVMYIAWASKAIKQNDLKTLRFFSNMQFGKEGKKPFAWLDSEWGIVSYYVFVPILTITVLVLPGGNSSAIFILGVMIITAFVGGVDSKKIMFLAVAGILCLAACFGIYKISDGKMMTRIGTGIERVSEKPTVEEILQMKDKGLEGTTEYKKKMMKVQQPYSAKIAVHEGGLFRKGVGGSTQKYVVPVMYGDFIYCYILEETGLFGGILIIILYLSLIARGVKIVQNCHDTFAQTSVAGLIILITSQAFMHMAINLDMGPLTGQTLPVVSHGTSAYLCFCGAFGIILSMSKMSWEATSEEERQADLARGRTSGEPLEEAVQEAEGGKNE